MEADRIASFLPYKGFHIMVLSSIGMSGIPT